jgi:tetratricopeptide (TPR) repeat protein
MNEWLEAEQRVERAQQLSESHRWEEALAEIDLALAINPGNAAWHAHRGYISEELERWECAADAYAHAHELDPGDREISVALGAALARLGRFSKALALFEELARAHPDFEPAYCHRIGIYRELGRHEKAEEMFYLAQELDETCPHCFYHLGASLATREQFDRAVYCWKRVIALCPEYIGVNRLIAQAYRAQGKLDLAKDYYLREVREDPGDPELLFELAELTLQAGDVAMATARFAQIVELEPEHAPAHFALGEICLARGQLDQALQCFERAEAIESPAPDLPGLDARVGETLFRLGRFGEAKERLEAALAEDDDDDGAALRVLLGTCLLALGKVDDAADAFRRILATEADHAVAHHRLAVCLLRQGRFGAALEHCTLSLNVRPDFVLAMHTAALAQIHLARWREARSMLRRALRHEPAHPDLQRLSERLWRYRLRYGLKRLLRPLRAVFNRRTGS